ncbi:MAG: hypothetical protein R6V26_09740 [Roseovarius sp.]
MFGKIDPLLQLRHRTGQELEHLPAIPIQRTAQFGLADDCAQIFRNDRTGMLAPVAIHHVSDSASHADDPL